MCRKLLPFWGGFVLIFILTGQARCQDYGLRFFSHEVEQDLRTSLNCTAAAPLELPPVFDLEFDFEMKPYQIINFGYIFRLINDKSQNLDLLYDEFNFKIVRNEELSRIAIHEMPVNLFGKWTHFHLHFDLNKKTLLLSYNNKPLRDYHLNFSASDKFRLYFGRINSPVFGTTDVVPMDIKDIRINENNKVLYHWPLNETHGQTARELIQGNDGAVENPDWIKTRHYTWSKVYERTLSGNITSAYDALNERIYVFGKDSTIAFSEDPQKRVSIIYQKPVTFFKMNVQAIIACDQAFILDPSGNAVQTLNLKSQIWQLGTPPTSYVDYWHANKFFSAADSSIYTVGGYGHQMYRNAVLRYSIKKKSWVQVKTTGVTFTPRYLAALGFNEKRNKAYIIGGYGSATGQQILNPKNIYDFLEFDLRTFAFKKIYTLDPHDRDFTFANSLIIDEKEKSYYGLIFDNQKFGSRLHLLRGDFGSPDYTLMGTDIPYDYHDVTSFADLYYDRTLKRFYAVTIHRNNSNQSTVKIYALLGPPVQITETRAQKISSTTIWITFILGFSGLVAGIVLILRRKSKKVRADSPPVLRRTPVAVLQSTDSALKKAGGDEKTEIFLFGGLHILNKDHIDLNMHFTPLVKELFLIVLLYTLRRKCGVNADNLNELLWNDKSESSARNNRSVNIAKLKSALELIGHCQITKDSGYWKFNFDLHYIRLDYYKYLQLTAVKNNFNRDKILELIEITQRGNFLANSEYEWLDKFKSEIAYEIIDIYMQFISSVKLGEDPELMITLTSHIFYFDPVHEDALKIKCKILSIQGNNLLAMQTYEGFKKDYRRFYAEDYQPSFQEIIA